MPNWFFRFDEAQDKYWDSRYNQTLHLSRVGCQNLNSRSLARLSDIGCYVFERARKRMHEIYPNLLWIGHAFDVREPRGLFDVGITAVIDVAYEEPPAQIPRQLTYCRFPLNDGGGNDPNILLQTLRTATDFLRSNTRTIVACSAGMSRSPTIAAFALAYHFSDDPNDAIARIADIKSLELKPELWADTLTAFNKLTSNSNDEFDL